jgi:hypothetical protein
MRSIKLDVLDDDRFMVSFERPGRIEVSYDDSGHLVAHVYEGADVDLEQEPLGGYDSSVENESWKSGTR